MEYKASMDNFARVVTAAVVILFGVIEYKCLQNLSNPFLSKYGLILNVSNVILLDAVLFTCYFMSVQKYKITPGALIIVRPGMDKKINRNEISGARLLNQDEMDFTVRTFGSGGLFGYIGKFTNLKLGNMTCYATQKVNRILITTQKGETIIITPDDLGLLDALTTAANE